MDILSGKTKPVPSLFTQSAISNIAGSVSIACWIVVFSPQIIKNFRRQSTEGLSIFFIIIWLSGDLCNIVGGVCQGVLPTMLILAVYYAACDITLLGQCCWYRYWAGREGKEGGELESGDRGIDERTALIGNLGGEGEGGDEDGDYQRLSASGHLSQQSQSEFEDEDITTTTTTGVTKVKRRKRSSFSALRRELSLVDGSHLSPAVPLIDDNTSKSNGEPTPFKSTKKLTTFQSFLFNASAIILVISVGVMGWWVSEHLQYASDPTHHDDNKNHNPLQPEPIEFDTLGQVFGYFCATLYLSSRIPQLLLNYRRKSTEGVSVYLFLFACIGNTTYNISIFAHDISSSCFEGGVVGVCTPNEARELYARYIAVNASWIAGSLGTLLLDFGFFAQVFMYRKDEEDEREVAVLD